MSLDHPNKYEQSIEEYAEACRTSTAAHKASMRAQDDAAAAESTRQEKWRVVAEYRNKGWIKPGVYRLNNYTKDWCEGLVISPTGDYPDLLPMYR